MCVNPCFFISSIKASALVVKYVFWSTLAMLEKSKTLGITRVMPKWFSFCVRAALKTIRYEKIMSNTELNIVTKIFFDKFII